jgi:DNA topoisomerase-2
MNTTSKFFNNEYINFAAYDNLRKLGALTDGLKISARKILFTVMNTNITTPIKVDALSSKCAGLTEYLHGQDSLNGVTVGLAQDFVGANNLPMIAREGQFGTRFIPEAAAPRYIFTKKEKWFDDVFNPLDMNVCERQSFEGKLIEPKSLAPIIPLLFVNGTEGMSVGFAQKILNRDVRELMKWVFTYVKNPNNKKEFPIPSYRGFSGTVVKTDVKSFEIHGCIERINKTTLRITEIPVGVTYKKYIDTLDSLKEKKIISDYIDNCDTTNESIDFTIRISKANLEKIKDDYELRDKFKLISRVTENYTVLNENNQVEEFENPEDIAKQYVSFRLRKYQERKDFLLNSYKHDLIILQSKIKFIRGVIKGTYVINNKKKANIVDQIKADIQMIDDSYDYLLNMPLYSLTKERIETLVNQFKKKKEDFTIIKSTEIIDMWKNDYSTLRKNIKEYNG